MTTTTPTAQAVQLATVFDRQDDATVRLIITALPYSMTPVVNVIGLRQTLALIDSFAGQVFVIPRVPSRARFTQIQRVIGIDSAFQMAKHLGGKKLIIPRMKVLKRSLRGEEISRDVDVPVRATKGGKT